MYQITVQVDGMMCSMCEAHVNEAIRRAFPVEKVKSSHRKGQMQILSRQPLEEPAICAALEAAGYRVLGTKCEPYQNKKWFGLFG